MKTQKSNRAAKDKIPLAAKKTVAQKTSGEKNSTEDIVSDEAEGLPVVSSGNIKPRKGQLQKFLVDGLKDLYWAEQHLLKALMEMAAESTSEELRQAFKDHRVETEDHVSRLEEIFEMLGEKVQGKKCEAIEAIIKEVQTMIHETKDDTLTRDAALIIGGQKAEHYEIASYGGLIHVARSLGYTEAAELMEDTLAEEKQADENLTAIAEGVVYQHAIME